MNLDHPNNFIVSRLQNRVMLGHNQETRVVKADPANNLDGNVIFSQLEMARQAKRSAVQNCRYDETNSNHLIIAASHKGSTIHPFDLFNQQDAKVLSFLRIIILCSEFLLFCLECRFALFVTILFRSELFFSSNVETLWLQLSFQGPQSCSRVCCHQKI